jgi:RNase P subunit RPR2
MQVNVPAISVIGSYRSNSLPVSAQSLKPNTSNSSSPTGNSGVVLEFKPRNETVPSIYTFKQAYAPAEASSMQMNNLHTATSCKTCNSRQYVDQSTDMGVSFKNGGSVAPEAAVSAVFAHEREHVSIAQAKARKTGDYVQASISIQTDICPECKKVIVAGGTAEITTYSGYAKNMYMGAKEPILGQILDEVV